MTRCLSDAEIQAFVDGEGRPASAEHVAGCASCQRRIDDRRHTMAAISTIMNPGTPMPPDLDAQLRTSIAADHPGHRARGARGATALRATSAPPSWRRVGWMSAAASVAAAAAVAFVVFVALPRLGAPTTLSAAEVLGRSLENLSNAHGVERLEYDLVFSGVLNGPHRIEQLFDHDQPNRFRVANYGPDGVLESALSQDPATHQSSLLTRVDGRNYIIRLTDVPDSTLSLPQMVHTQIEATLTMMQAAADPGVAVSDTGSGRKYIVQMPQSTATRAAVPMELYQARAVIDASTFRVDEFDASGTVLKQPFAISFRLMRSVMQPPNLTADAFAIPQGPGDVVLQGIASTDPFRDPLTTALRELGRAKGL